MPYKMRKMPNKSCYKVYNKNTKRVFSKCASKKKAVRQMNLLGVLEKARNSRKTRKNKK